MSDLSARLPQDGTEQASAATTAEVLETAHRSEDIIPLFTLPCTVQDLPALHKVLSRQWHDDHQEGYTGRSILIGKLAEVHDSTTVPFLLQLYPSLHRYPSLQISVLRILANINTHSSISALAQLFQNQFIPNREDVIIFHPLCEAPSHARLLFPAVLHLIDSAAWQGPVYSMFVHLLDSNAISGDELRPARERFLSLLHFQIDTVGNGSRGSKDEYVSLNDIRFYNPTEILRMQIAVAGAISIGDTEITDLLKELTPDAELAPYAVAALLRYGHTLPQELIDSTASHTEGRLILYTQLAAAGRLDHFPARYRTQELIAEAYVAQLLSADGAFTPCKLFATREITTGNHQGRYFLFGLEVPDEEDTGSQKQHMAILYGPQPLDRSKIVMSSDQIFTLLTALNEEHIDMDFHNLLSFKFMEVDE